MSHNLTGTVPENVRGERKPSRWFWVLTTKWHICEAILTSCNLALWNKSFPSPYSEVNLSHQEGAWNTYLRAEWAMRRYSRNLLQTNMHCTHQSLIWCFISIAERRIWGLGYLFKPNCWQMVKHESSTFRGLEFLTRFVGWWESWLRGCINPFPRIPLTTGASFFATS